MRFITWIGDTWRERQRDVLIAFAVVLIGLACFGWGYRLGASGNHTPIVIEMHEGV